MAGTSESTVGVVARFFATYRLLFYLGGLIVMSLPLGLAWVFDVHLQPALRTSIVIVTFGAIVATYLSERWVERQQRAMGGGAVRTVSLRRRLSLFASLAGVAVAIYMFVTNRFGYGLIFLAGAGLFYQLATRSQSTDD
ncbi:MAG: hypothetical protein ABEJ58_00780 [Halodesulfurarchaeum sp.]